MRLSYPRLPRNVVAVTILLVAFILSGGGLMNWYRERMFWDQYWDLERTGRTTIKITRTPRPEALRRREKIEVAPKPVTPTVITPIDRTPVINHIETSEPVVFLTIDDGITKDRDIANFMVDRQLPITSFLTIHAIGNDIGYFEPLSKNNASIQNHTVTHPHMPKYPYETQRNEICATSDALTGTYGVRPTLFRPPYGEHNDDTLKAAAACGIKATVLWNVVVAKGGMSYQKEPKLKPGDIILLHYTQELKADLEVTLQTIRDQGYKIGRLEDWTQ